MPRRKWHQKARPYIKAKSHIDVAKHDELAALVEAYLDAGGVIQRYAANTGISLR